MLSCLDSEVFSVKAERFRFRFVTWVEPVEWPPFVGSSIPINSH